MFFLAFSILAAVLGIISKFMGGNHLRVWRNDSLAAAGSSAIVAWAVTALAFGYVHAFLIWNMINLVLVSGIFILLYVIYAGWRARRST